MRTAVARIVRAHELKVRGISLAWGEVAPVPVARHADTHCTCCVSTQAFPARSRMMMSALTLPNPRSRQEREARLAPSVSSSAKRTTSSTSPPPRGNVRMHRGESKNVRARARSAHAFGAERVARGSDSAAAGNRARSARAIGAERVARGGASWHAGGASTRWEAYAC